MDEFDYVFEEVEGRRERRIRRPFRRLNFDEDRALSDFAFKEAFRLSRSQVEYLHNQIGAQVANETRRNGSFTSSQKILASLHWMGNGGQYHGVGAMHGIAKSSVCRQLHEVVPAICDLFLRIVSWPEHDRDSIAADFLRKGGFPSVAGCVDGTMVNIDAPSDHEEQYVNRHGNHALNVMAICGPNLEIYSASARWPGSLHDSRVLRNTRVFHKFEVENWRPFPGAVILGDSAYPQKEWLVAPLNRNPEDPTEQAFNRAHRQTRRLIENCFGVLKEKFPCLNHLRLEPVFAAKVVMACITCHNIAITVDRQDGHNEVQVDHVVVGEDPDENPDDPEEAVEVNRRNPVILRRLLNYFQENH